MNKTFLKHWQFNPLKKSMHYILQTKIIQRICFALHNGMVRGGRGGHQMLHLGWVTFMNITQGV